MFHIELTIRDCLASLRSAITFQVEQAWNKQHALGPISCIGSKFTLMSTNLEFENHKLCVLPRARMHEGVKKMALFVCQSVCQSSKNFEI